MECDIVNLNFSQTLFFYPQLNNAPLFSIAFCHLDDNLLSRCLLMFRVQEKKQFNIMLKFA